MSSSGDMFMEDDRFDGLYMNVAQQARGIEPLLDTVFSFLRRKTDFFDGPNGSGDDNSRAALEKVQQVFYKHAKVHQKQKQQKAQAAAVKKTTAAKKKQTLKPSSKSMTTTTTTTTATTTTTTTASTSQNKPYTTTPKKVDDEVIEMGTDAAFDVSTTTSEPVPKEQQEQEAPPATSTPTPTPSSAAPLEQQLQEEETGAPNNHRRCPPVGNGGTVPGKYVWTQTLSEVTVTISIPRGTRGRDLIVDMAKQHLKVGLSRNKDSAGENIIINAPLTKPIVVHDSFWTIEDGNRLVLQFQKLNGMEWWKGVCQGDEVYDVDVTTIQPEESSKLDDLDGDTRQTVEKMMYNQRQKALGLPTTDEQHKLDMLEIFKQQHPELDFSSATIK